MDSIGKERSRFLTYTAILISVVLVGTVGFWKLEHHTLSDSFYFTIVTIATVGYGDIHPSSSIGKLLVIFLIIGGVGTFLGVIANATEMMLNRRDRDVRIQKLNMVMGAFFSQIGMQLLKAFSSADTSMKHPTLNLVMTNKWTKKDFRKARIALSHYNYHIDIDRIDLESLKSSLVNKCDFLIRLLENPYLLEQETFSDVIRAIFHLHDELCSRERLTDLPDADKKHLAGDITRVYSLLLREWTGYMGHLKDKYPYLFSLAARTNPFDKNASPIIE